MIREWARQLLTYEAFAGAPAVHDEPVAVLVYDKLRRQLSVPVGVDGFQGLASRALTLAKAEAPLLNSVQVTAEGGLRGLRELESHADPDQESTPGVVLIAHLLGLLSTFLGGATTCHLVQDMFPQLQSEEKSETSVPFENLLHEVYQLRNVSEHLESLANQHAELEGGLTIISGNIRNIAATLDVFVVIKKASEGRREDESRQQTPDYVM
jgi:hypothetical protein